jgi:LuxR family transcriptional regulator, maltose regulon positive regulatory protein
VEIMMAEDNPSADQMKQILQKIIEQTREGGSPDHLIEASLLTARLAIKDRQPETAAQALAQALCRGSGSGYFQIFCDRKDELVLVLKALSEKNIRVNREGISDRLLQLLQVSQPGQRPEKAKSEPAEADPGTQPGLIHDLVEQLSARELEILGLISQGLSNQDISDKLYLTLGTVKWHTSNIYGKLGVRGRTQAIAQARKANLIR